MWTTQHKWNLDIFAMLERYATKTKVDVCVAPIYYYYENLFKSF
jgi:hypothetical protein